MGTPGIVLIPVNDGAEAREIFDRLAGGPTYLVGTQVFPDDDEAWFHQLGYTMTMQEFFERFSTPAFYAGFNAGKGGPMIKEAVMTLKNRLVGAKVPQVSPADAAKRAKLQQTLRNKSNLQAQLAEMNAEGETIRAKVHDGTLTMEALKRHGERMRPIETALADLHAAQDFLANTCTDAKLVAEYAEKRARKAKILKRLSDARGLHHDAVEQLRMDHQVLAPILAFNEQGGKQPEHELARAKHGVESSEQIVAQYEQEIADAEAELSAAVAGIRDVRQRMMAS